MKLDFYTTRAQPCNYLPNQQSKTLFADPNADLDKWIYSQLAEHGFRRSGEQIYRPDCTNCNSCIPVRVQVAKFTPNRNQQRTWQRNKDIEIVTPPASFSDEHYHLFQHYIHKRHHDGGMDNLSRESYLGFLTSNWSDTIFYEFRLKQKLLAVTVADQLVNGLSAVYTFFDPAYATRSLGNYAILWLIHETKRLHLSRLYLGYWVKECTKMAYKDQYHPFEFYKNDTWQIVGTK